MPIEQSLRTLIFLSSANRLSCPLADCAQLQSGNGPLIFFADLSSKCFSLWLKICKAFFKWLQGLSSSRRRTVPLCPRMPPSKSGRPRGERPLCVGKSCVCVKSLGLGAPYRVHRGPHRAGLLWCRRLEPRHRQDEKASI